MHSSRQTAAHFTLMMEIDVTEAVKLCESMPRARGAGAAPRPRLDDMIVMATAKALGEHRRINCSRVGEEICQWKQINIGVAAATERGLIVPVIRDADKKSLSEMATVARELAERAREGTLEYADVSQGTFTITSLAAFGIDVFTPIINPPEAAILGVGRVAERPVVQDGAVVIRSMMHLSLSIDHRVVDGVPAARFMNSIRRLLEQPAWMTPGINGSATSHEQTP
jgi:pyruvate dehydrogenase E2 component (dihydrolipoamide acetyltransferase)